jgi:putative ABC transport system substrate-binding protein
VTRRSARRGPTREYVASLALLAYEASRQEMFERAGALVARVLRGARPGELAVEAPTRYELCISQSAA